MSDPVGVGVIGAGAIAQIAHLVALSRMDGVEAVALCDNDLPKAQALARGEVPRVSLDDQLTLQRTLDAIRRSAREGREVSL